MEDALMQIGIGGIFAVLMVREVLNFLTRRREGSQPQGVTREDIEQVFLSRETAKVISSLEHMLEKQNAFLDTMCKRIEEVHKTVTFIEDNIHCAGRR